MRVRTSEAALRTYKLTSKDCVIDQEPPRPTVLHYVISYCSSLPSVSWINLGPLSLNVELKSRLFSQTTEQRNMNLWAPAQISE